MRPNPVLWTLLLALGGACFSARGETATLVSIADTMIANGSVPGNGSSASVASGQIGTGARARALFQFNFSSIPANAMVSAASLRLTVTDVPVQTPQNSSFGVHRLQTMWDELEAIWAGPNSMDTWPAGGDFVGNSSASTFVSGEGAYTFTSSELAADVQRWVTNAESNAGWILISEAESSIRSARRWGTRENLTVADRPELRVTYTVSPTQRVAPVITNWTATGGNFRFTFNAEASSAYRVEFKNSLSITNWQTLTNIASLPVPQTVGISDAIIDSQRYYRVIVP